MKSKTIIAVVSIFSLLLWMSFCFPYTWRNHSQKIIESGVRSEVSSSIHADRNLKKATKKNNLSNVIGLWKSEEDENWQLEFLSNGSCIEKYVGSSTDTSTYSISNTTPQCGVTVAVNQYTEYIKLTFAKDGFKNTCYLLNGTTDSTLSLSPMQSYKIMMFKKQP